MFFTSLKEQQIKTLNSHSHSKRDKRGYIFYLFSGINKKLDYAFKVAMQSTYMRHAGTFSAPETEKVAFLAAISFLLLLLLPPAVVAWQEWFPTKKTSLFVCYIEKSLTSSLFILAGAFFVLAEDSLSLYLFPEFRVTRFCL